jgi:hypothetical protein
MAGALTVYGQSLGMMEALAAKDPTNAEYRSALANWIADYGETQLEAGLPSEAIASLKRAVGILEAQLRSASADYRDRVCLTRVQKDLVDARAGARGRRVE